MRGHIGAVILNLNGINIWKVGNSPLSTTM
jgi:hypothetical protein